jgi:heme/copper-type cytochrome/quinol oxidase subunit 3
MQIPYETTARPDTGLYNAKLGIWLFLASEVMLFGGLFSAYIFLRMGSDDGYWPTGLLNVPVGTLNTAILIASSVTVVLAWAALKMRQWAQYKLYMGITIVCALIFLVVKLAVEWPEKFQHFGAFIKKDKWAQYEDYLGNDFIREHNANHRRQHPPRTEISGHLHAVEVTHDPAVLEKMIKDREEALRQVDEKLKEENEKLKEGKEEKKKTKAAIKELEKQREKLVKELGELPDLKFETFVHRQHLVAEPGHDKAHPVTVVKGHDPSHGPSPSVAEKLVKLPGVKAVAFEVELDAVNANPKSEDNLNAHFWPRKRSTEVATIKAEDISSWSAFAPKHSSYFAVYFTITGLHGLHVLAGALVFIYFFFWGEKLYRKNPEHMANRIEVSGLFWHFVDLVWIFVFPIFYLL